MYTRIEIKTCYISILHQRIGADKGQEAARRLNPSFTNQGIKKFKFKILRSITSKREDRVP